MRVLVVGGGGREHAIAKALVRASEPPELYAVMGNPNPGIRRAAREALVHDVTDVPTIVAWAKARAVDLAVIGPEAPLVAGVADELRHAGIAVFGPTAAAARIEGSKSFAKEVMAAAGVPTAAAMAVARPPCVVKADGLAGGKGVFVCRTAGELDEGLRAAAGFAGPLVIEW